MKNALIILGLGFILISCNRNKYNVGVFPQEPVNLKEANSSLDDINSDIPFISGDVHLVFSTNRANSQTGDFNLTLSYLNFYWDRSEGILTVKPSNILFDRDYESFRDLVRKTESSAHEKGPYSFLESENNRVLLFSREVNGMYVIFSESEKTASGVGEDQSFRILDQASNEIYPSFYGSNFLKGMEPSPAKPEMLLFTSDKDGQFDIYESPISEGQSPLQFLSDSNPKTVRKLSLNTSSNDHMPFVYGDLLVFSSDRPGGFGGFDLYYAQKTGDGWSEPVNFGPRINSEYDEYRPVVSDHPGFANRLMIFSSNRPGGLGGFDLYFMGIPKF
ncbi:PD40 domain-containing protein [Algoriphagus sp. Y33]|uniref:PD40 domain-containing protein n=1 Tax=Algoriphagus sp. Y33 TaxID=2772483 RepID=UPI00177B3589|nr:PD40 domain-containing protein [Algoriphagus sp. Y33]